MNKIVFFLCLLFHLPLHAQNMNTTLVSNFDYEDTLNDIWGYAAPDGTEYAIVGLQTGTSIVNLADPANPQEVIFIPGLKSTWRDIKTWEEHAYVIADNVREGLLIIDLSGLPNTVSFELEPILIPNEVGTDTLFNAHNLFIDEKGFIYLAGGNVNQGGVVILDAVSNPALPPFVGKSLPIYSHDVYVRDDVLYSSEIYAGIFTVYDVMDKEDISILGAQSTAFAFTHNTWLSDDGKTIFTTDEKADAPVGAYDISNFSDIKELDQFVPAATINEHVIPHNVHVKDDFLIISYYSDGIVVVDASKPDNLVEVGAYDTFLGNNGGYFGSWGAYPFLPSGLILASDRQTGLYVIQADYQRASFLEGQVKDVFTTAPVPQANVQILGDKRVESTDLSGLFKTGSTKEGEVQVRISAKGYETQTVTVVLGKEELTQLNVSLKQVNDFVLSGKVVAADTNEGIEKVAINLKGEFQEHNLLAQANGTFQIPNFYPGTYRITIGKWGYAYKHLTQDITAADLGTITLNKAYEDNFSLALEGWAVENEVAEGSYDVVGVWERAVSIGYSAPNGTIAIPEKDYPGDEGRHCFITGNLGALGGNNVSGGSTVLISPLFDVFDYEEPIVRYNTWVTSYTRLLGSETEMGDDSLKIYIENGITKVLVDIIPPAALGEATWQASEINIAQYIVPTKEMRISFEMSDQPTNENITNALVDNLIIEESNAPTSVSDNLNSAEPIQVHFFPNPFYDNLHIRYQFKNWNGDKGMIGIFDITGQLIEEINIFEPKGWIGIGESLNTGIYLVEINDLNGNRRVMKVVKK